MSNQSKQTNSNKNEIAQASSPELNNNSANPESANVPTISNINAVTSTPIPTASPTSVIDVGGIWVISFRYKDKDDWEGRTDVRFK
ncbi:MAG: hypothetical protein H0W77_05495 [Acidobacteria bacterium]|nr:hypothetical protein [Acidobacteriota bacterium]